MTTPLTKLIAENKRQDWHRKLPSSYAADSSPVRLARVTEVLLEGMNKVLNRAMVHDHEGYEEIARNAIKQATAIAEGKE